jgi:hypothetical protein
MKISHLAELKSACKKSISKSEEEKIDIGETIWFSGKPVRSPKGTIALDIGINQTIIINEKNILNVIKEDNFFYVEIASNSNYLYKIEIISNNSTHSECTCDKGISGSVSKQASNNPTTTADPCALKCRIVRNCRRITDRDGYVREVCFPYPVCESPCTFA